MYTHLPPKFALKILSFCTLQNALCKDDVTTCGLEKEMEMHKNSFT